MNIYKIIIFTIIGPFLLAGAAQAATSTQTLTINATVAAAATLTLSKNSIHFPDADPDGILPLPPPKTR